MTRTQLIKIIHVAKRELRMDEETYRQLLNTYAGIESTREMNIGQLNQILDAMKKIGFKVRTRKKEKLTDWLNTSAASRVIETLKQWQTRERKALEELQGAK